MIKPWTPDTLRIAKALNHQVRLVGGCVRDFLLDRPCHDIDLATPLLPSEVIKCLTAANIQNRVISPRHGVVEATIGKEKFEITTLRQDTYRTRRETVTFITDYAQDALRRDFTINALSMDTDGKVYDYTDGLQDLKNKNVRFIGDPNTRIWEDPLRLLRYLRFWSLFGKEEPDPSVISLFSQHRSGLATVSLNRRQKEFYKILMCPHVIHVLTILKQTGMLDIIISNADIKALNHLLDTNPTASVFARLSALGYRTNRKGHKT